MKKYKTYPGGKNGNGTYQNIINYIPECDILASLFVGNCGIIQNIDPAPITIVNDLDPDVYANWPTSEPEQFFSFNLDAIAVLKAKRIGAFDLDQPEVVIYLDPPYLKESRKQQADIYQCELPRDKHIELIRACKEYKFAKIIISHYPHDLYLMLRGWHTHDFQSMTRGGMVTERIFMNYPKPQRLHDYRYIGQNFTDRQALKRAKTNIINKLKKLDPVFRNSILKDLRGHFFIDQS